MGSNKLEGLSVFFPLYNEELNIKPLVKEALSAIPKYAKRFEILLINDGSTDNTKKIGEELSLKHPEVKMITQENTGYGGALKLGFKSASYDWVFYSDGDRQFKLDDLRDFINWTDTYNFIIGYRKRRAEGFFRSLIAGTLKIWNSFFFGFPLSIKDIDCAFKLINKKVLSDIGPLVSDGGMVSTEILLKANQKEHLIKQLPVSHYVREFGSSTGDSFKVIKKAIRETAILLKEFPKRTSKLKIGMIAFGVFLLLLPISANINFLQNDDYTHYRLVEQFLTGNFKLDPYLGATFYLQGLMGSAFAYLFGVGVLPVLTLMVSILGFYVFLRILNDFFKLEFSSVVSLGFLYFLSPLALYSVWGFMTENYFMFFFLLSVYFILSFMDKADPKSFMRANLLIILSYFVRQFAFVTSAAFAVHLLVKKRYFLGILQLFLLGGLLYFHYYHFPLTPQMYEGGINLGTLLNFKRTFSLLVVIGIYFSIFLFPLIISYFTKLDFLRSKKKYLLLLFIPLFIFVSNNFEPKKIDFTVRSRDGKVVPQFSKVEFPYFGNVFGRKGFLEENLTGNKYHYPGFFDLFVGFDILGKVGFILLLVILILNIRSLTSFYAIYLVGFSFLLILAPKIFDRYLLSLVPIGILFLVSVNKGSVKLQNFLVLGFIALLLFLGYQYSSDFILVNKYIWSKAERLSVEFDIPKKYFNVNHSWRNLYPLEGRQWLYTFEYPESKRLTNSEFEIFATHTIDYPLNFYISPEITIFQRQPQFDK